MAEEEGPSPLPRGPESEDAEAQRAYVEALIARGEAARPGPDGRLPPGATHEIVEERAGELPKVVRRRFT